MKYWVTIRNDRGKVTTNVDLTDIEANKFKCIFDTLDKQAFDMYGVTKLVEIEDNKDNVIKISAISDLHGNLPVIAECDILCICGDISPLDIQFNHNKMTKWLHSTFLPWVESLKCRKVLMVAGNHDQWFETASDADKLMLEYKSKYKLKYLQDEAYSCYGVQFYGTPRCKQFGNWSFMHNTDKLKEYYDKIPDNIDVLLTHDAPIEMNGVAKYETTGEDFGNAQLYSAILSKKPKYTLCGHIHSGNHSMQPYFDDTNKYMYDDPEEGFKCKENLITNIVNVSLLSEEYKVNYEPFTFNFEIL